MLLGWQGKEDSRTAGKSGSSAVGSGTIPAWCFGDFSAVRSSSHSSRRRSKPRCSAPPDSPRPARPSGANAAPPCRVAHRAIDAPRGAARTPRRPPSRHSPRPPRTARGSRPGAPAPRPPRLSPIAIRWFRRRGPRRPRPGRISPPFSPSRGPHPNGRTTPQYPRRAPDSPFASFTRPNQTFTRGNPP